MRKKAMQFVEGIERVYGPNIETYEADIEITKARLEHNNENGMTLFIMVDWKIKNPYIKKQLAVHMVTQANIPLTLTFNKDSQALVSRLNRFKIDLIEYKPYFKSQVPFKALQHLFK
jgi:hypothetical protein